MMSRKKSASADEDPETNARTDAADKEAAIESTMPAVQRLFDTAAAQGRDLKLVVALLNTIVRLVTEKGTDVLVPPDSEKSRRRMRPEIRAHILAIIDSFSDDEAARFLGIGTRQVRRRAQQGLLHFFTVGNKRRYGTWQFDDRYGVLPRSGNVIASIPSEWSPEDVASFMTTPQVALDVRGLRLTPRTWLVLGLEPTWVVDILRVNRQQRR